MLSLGGTCFQLSLVFHVFQRMHDFYNQKKIILNKRMGPRSGGCAVLARPELQRALPFMSWAISGVLNFSDRDSSLGKKKIGNTWYSFNVKIK